jgi:hypothetical protein
VGLRIVADLTAAGWIKDRLHPFAQDVGSVIPTGFDDYARVFHPAYRDGRDPPVTWREIADANGRTVHPEMQFGSIAGTWSRRSPRPGLWSVDPHVGTSSVEIARALAGILRARTSTPEMCWFALWEGFGDLVAPPATPRLELPHRRYYVAHGRVDDVAQSFGGLDTGWPYRSPSLWWPDDRSWFVSTEVDLAWTYVGGATPAIDEVLAHPALEALRARLSDGITYDSDRINPPVPMKR